MKRRSRTLHWIAAATACAASVPAIEAAAAEPTAQASSTTTRRSSITSSRHSPRKPRCSTGHRRQGMDADGRHVERVDGGGGRPDGRAGMPLLRHPNVGPNSHFYTSDAGGVREGQAEPELDLRGHRVLHRADGIGNLCRGKTEPMYRSFYPGAQVSESNHRFLPDLTMFQKMAPASILEGVVMCSPLSSAQIGNDAVRLLEQSTFGPTDVLVAHVVAVGPQASCRTIRGSGSATPATSTFPPAARPSSARPIPIRPARATITRCSSSRPIFSERARQQRPAATARRIRAFADLRHLRASTSTRPMEWRPTSRSSSTTRSATTRTC